MKKRIAIVLVLTLVLLTSCSVTSGDADCKEPPREPSQQFELEELRQKFPEYFDLSTAKGLEVYVWQLAEGSYSCGVLPGTNRNKSNEEIWRLTVNSARIEEMKVILSSYDIPKEDIIIIPCVQPISSYFYQIDESYIRAVNALFE